MEESKQPTHGVAGDDKSAQTSARHDEATSSDTLSDLQESQNDSAASSGETSGASDAESAPAPDGMPGNAGGGTADGRDSGGPM